MTLRKTSSDKKLGRLEKEEARAAFLDELFRRLHNAGELKKRSEAYRLSRAGLFSAGYGMSFRRFSRLISKWKEEPSANSLFRRKPKPQKWGVVSAAMVKRETKRAQLIHGVFNGLKSTCRRSNLSQAYRLCGGELRKNQIFISAKTFGRMFQRWNIDQSPRSLMRHRRTGNVISERECRAVFDYAMREGISLETAVDRLKATPGAKNIPSAATVRNRLPWAGHLISFGRKTNSIVTPRGANA